MYGKTCDRLKNKRRLFMSKKYIKKKEKKKLKNPTSGHVFYQKNLS